MCRYTLYMCCYIFVYNCVYDSFMKGGIFNINKGSVPIYRVI